LESSDASAGSSPKGKSNLLAIGSAAVLAVYGAGFFRTRAAAQRFSDASDQRRPPAPALPVSPTAAPVGVTLHDSAAGDTVPNVKVVRVTTVSPAKESLRTEPPRETKATSVPAEAAAPRIDSITPQVVAKSAAAEPATAAPVTVPVDSSAQQAEKAIAAFKDGTYRGWGTSRHGDIEAAVEIRNGKITSAYITQCLTRYSCSWISHLPGQVVARQSPEVDYVSGATQSTNAFYYAIVQALAKAK